MITKSPTWNMVVEGLKDLHQAKKFTDKVMKQILEVWQRLALLKYTS